jgi:hypothetical protein
MDWFNYQRLFQFNTWGQLALLAAFVLFQFVPFVISTIFSLLRAISGMPARPTSSPDDIHSKTFQQALADGDIRVRGCILGYMCPRCPIFKNKLFGLLLDPNKLDPIYPIFSSAGRK